jgi:hypothetical protein
LTISIYTPADLGGEGDEQHHQREQREGHGRAPCTGASRRSMLHFLATPGRRVVDGSAQPARPPGARHG